jgi:hypothetical protein
MALLLVTPPEYAFLNLAIEGKNLGLTNTENDPRRKDHF